MSEVQEVMLEYVATSELLTEKLRDIELLKILSHIGKKEADNFSLLYTVAKRYNLPLVEQYVLESLRFKLSVKGRRAKDIVKIATGSRRRINIAENVQKFVKRFTKEIGEEGIEEEEEEEE